MNEKICCGILTLSLMMSFSVNVIASEQDSTVVDLPDVVVQGAKEIKKGNLTQLYLSKENISFGTNALDAISSLSRFDTRLNATDLRQINGMPVTILVNGVKQDGNVLRSYQAEDISRIDYYEQAPAKYMMYGSGPLVDIVLRRRHDYLIGGNILASNNTTFASGSNSASVHYIDSLNMVRASYGGSYYDNDDLQRNAVYDYGNNDLTKVTEKNGKMKQLSNNASAVYQRYQGRHLFNAQFTYSWNTRKTDNPSTTEIILPKSSAWGKSSDRTRNYSDVFALDLYYRYMFDANRSLVVDFIGTFGKSGTSQILSNNLPEPWQYLDYDLENRLHNRNNSFFGHAQYIQPLFGATFSAVLQYTYGRLKQHDILTGNDVVSSNNNEYAYVDLMWNRQTYWFGPLLGVKVNTISTPVGSRTQVSPDFRFSAGMLGKGFLKNFTFTWNFAIEQVGQSLAETTGSETFIDRNFISRGNPELNQYTNGVSNIGFNYSASNGRYYFSANVATIYSHHPYVSTLYEEEDLAIMQMQRINHSWKTSLMLSGSARPLNWLMLQASGGYTRNRYNIPGWNVRTGRWGVRGSVIFIANPWTFQLYAEAPGKQYDGCMISYNGPTYRAAVQWQWRRLALGAMWQWSDQKIYTMAATDGFSYNRSMKTPNHRYMAMVYLSWSFSKGKSRNHAGKTLDKLKIDTGLRENRF